MDRRIKIAWIRGRLVMLVIWLGCHSHSLSLKAQTAIRLEAHYSQAEFSPLALKEDHESAMLLLQEDGFVSISNKGIYSFGYSGAEGRGQNELLILGSNKFGGGSIKDSFGWPFNPVCFIYLPAHLRLHLNNPQITNALISFGDGAHRIEGWSVPDLWPMAPIIRVRMNATVFPHDCEWTLSLLTNLTEGFRVPLQVEFGVQVEPGKPIERIWSWVMRIPTIVSNEALFLDGLKSGRPPKALGARPVSFSRTIDLRARNLSEQYEDLTMLSEALRRSDSRQQPSRSRLTRYWPFLISAAVLLAIAITSIQRRVCRPAQGQGD